MRLPLFATIVTALLTAALAHAQIPAPTPVLDHRPDSALPAPAPTVIVDGPTTNGSVGDVFSLLPFGPTDRFWGSAELLLWRINDPRLPPLVTSSPAGTSFGSAGVLGQATTSVLFGDGPQNMGTFSGGRFTLGYWIAPVDCGLGVQASGFWLGKRTDSFSTSSDSTGNPPIGRPYVSAITGTEQSYTVSFGAPTPFASGSVNAALSSWLRGAEFDIAYAGENPAVSHRTWLLGFRYAELGENLSITQNTNLLPGNGILFAGNAVVLAPDGVLLADSFTTRNKFYGAQVGVRQVFDFDRFDLDVSAKLAVGSVRQEVDIEGASTIVAGGVLTHATVPGGLLAVSSNIGQTSHYRFAVLPEADVKLGYKICENLTSCT
jgi:Putative beta barrel porin-7 (BBP7)